MNIGLMIVSNFRLHISHILSVLINTLISRSHINFISSHLVTIFLSNHLCFWYWLLISCWTYSNWNWYPLIMLSFILFTFLIRVKMYMNVVWVIIIIIFIVSIVIWSTASWKTTSWIVIRVSIRHHWRSTININNVITSTNINSTMMTIVWQLRNWNMFWNIFTINIYYINYILTMLRNGFTIINFIYVFNIEWISLVRIYKFSILIENIIPLIFVFKLLSKYILYLL